MGAAVRIRMDGIISSLFPSVFQTTKLKIKTGLVLLQKESRYAPSCGEICFVCVRSAEILAAHRISAEKACNDRKAPVWRDPEDFVQKRAEQAGNQTDAVGGHQQVCDDQKGKQCGKDRMKP